MEAEPEPPALIVTSSGLTLTTSIDAILRTALGEGATGGAVVWLGSDFEQPDKTIKRNPITLKPSIFFTVYVPQSKVRLSYLPLHGNRLSVFSPIRSPITFYNRYVFDFASQSVLLAKKNGTSRNLRTLGEISASLCEICLLYTSD